MGCQGGGENFDKRNVVLELGIIESMGCQGGGGKKMRKGMLLLNLNH